MSKPNAMAKAEQIKARYGCKIMALKHAKQVYYMNPTDYWERIVKELER